MKPKSVTIYTDEDTGELLSAGIEIEDELKIVDGGEFYIERVSPCEGCYFYDKYKIGECEFPEDLELECGPETVYKEALIPMIDK